MNALRAFEAVARRGSFTAGAQALHVSQSALSRHVAGLEDLLGRRLLERRPQGLTLTEAGAALLPTLRASFDRLEGVLNAVMRDDAREARALRVHMPPSFLHQMALPILRDFRREFPDVPIDLSSAHVTGLPAGALDVAVVYDRPRAGDAVADLLWMARVTPVCTPRVAERCAGMTLAEFLTRNDLLHVKLDGQPRGLLWSNFAGRCGVTVEAGKGLAFDTSVLAVRYAMADAGVALADVTLFAREIAERRLAAPFDATFEDGYGYYLILHPEDLDDPAVALFRSWMIGRFAGGAAAQGDGERGPLN